MVPPQTTHRSCEQPSHAAGVNQPKAFAGGNSTTYADKVKANIWQATARRSARLVAKETQVAINRSTYADVVKPKTAVRAALVACKTMEVSHQAIATKNIKKKSHELAAIANWPRNDVDNVLPCRKVLPVTDGEKDAKALSWQSISNPFGHPAVCVDALSGRNILLASGGARDATVLSQLSSVHPLGHTPSCATKRKAKGPHNPKQTSKTSGTFMKEDEAGSHHQSLLKDQRRSPTGTSGRAKIELLSVSEALSSDLSSLGEDEDTFYPIESGYAKIYDKRNNQIIAMVEFIEFSNLSKQQWNDLNYLSVFLHQCKEFISPVASQSRKCGGVMWALGWRKGYKELEILGRYRNQKAIDNNPRGFAKLMKKSSRVGQILWDTFHCFGNVAVEKNHNYMKKHNIPSVADKNFPKTPGDQSPFGFASNLAFSSHGFYNHQHKDRGDATELPLAFALVIPTSKTTGKIATKSEGYDVDNGQFIFRDIQIALNFKPDVIRRIIFRAQEYVHGTLRPTEPTNYTKLGISLQVATKTSNICKRYLKGEFDDDSDLYFSGVDKLLE
ncbi:hypothetical protein PCANC_25517 [Puccinia coronata f. sp. avenae]|uniref:Tet-like 2OG-Fe(II) oxygenase domain-containing protein n=1 Tax=Puccinia coronata f. sp. avenae TaxID=200324 RepID=A0A2N5TJQ5_9BASI|nr:hypothetical protein PCANC_25517 [Puccinia coronata f. sp. avenae]